MPPIHVLMKPASGACNMSCDYCFYCDEAAKRKQEFFGLMSEPTLKNVIRKTMLRGEGFVSYAYQGGEPTLRGLDFFKKALEYQRQYNKNGIAVHNALQTNGYFLDEEWCRFFKENHFLIGISVDGIKETHDCCRHDKNGGGTYERVVKNIKMLDQYGVDYNILTVVNKAVAENITGIYEAYGKKRWMYQQYIACLDPLGEAHGKNVYALLPKQYGEFLIRLFHLWYDDWKRGRQPYIRQFDNFIGILKGISPESCEQRGICGLQNVVEADGSVYPCDFYMTDEYRLGNYNENRQDEIDKKREEIGFIERSGKLSKECTGCAYYSLCRGGCQRNRDFQEKTGYFQNYFCESYRMFFDACLEKMKEVAAGM